MKNRTRKKSLNKTIFRDIKGSFGRFFAIFAIIALGVGFFSGVKVTTPVMINTIDNLYNEKSLYDYKLVSTLGWEDKDVEKVRSRGDVKYAEGAFQYDILCLDNEGKDLVFKAYSLTENVNGLMLREGRLPSADNEVLIDNSNRSGFKIGDTMRLSDSNPKENREHFKYDEYTVVGFADSVLYINFERGNSSLGNGIVNGFIYLTKGGFDEEIYTEIYVKLSESSYLYSDEYYDEMDELRPSWETITDDAAVDRFDRIYSEAEEEIADARETLAEEKADAEKELSDAKKELEDGKAELDDAAVEIEEGEQELADASSKLSSAKRTLDSSKSQLDSAKNTLDSSKKQLDSSKAVLDSSFSQLVESKTQLDAAKTELDNGKTELDNGKAELAAGKAELDKNAAILSSTKTTLENSKAELDAGKTALDQNGTALQNAYAQLTAQENALEQAEQELQAAETMGLLDEETLAAKKAELAAGREALAAARTEYNTGFAQYEAALAQWDEGLAQYNAGLAQYEAGQAQYEEGLAQWQEADAQLKAAEAEWEAGKAQYDAGLAKWEAGKAQYDDGLAQWNSGKDRYDNGLAQYNSGLAKWNSGKAEYNKGLREYNDGVKELEEGKQEYEDGLKEYEDGLKEYENGVKEFNEKIADAEKEIDDAEAELNDLEKPETFLLERNTNISYSCFESDSAIVGQVARIFPIFFILVAALVCMTTMTRMVEEQRGQIGTLKALGYSNGDIIKKFTVYSGTAALLGCVSGYTVCIFLFPHFIWIAYQMMYINIPLIYSFNWVLAAISLVVSIACSVGTTLVSCRYELGESAASLMRPKAPKPGKRVFLENIPFIWNRMKFLHKVSIRNIFRYKRRFFMMIVGISGCTALLITGYGMKDSVAGFAEAQYDEIQTTDVELTFKNSTGDMAPQDVIDMLNEDSSEYMIIRSAAWDLLYKDSVKGVNLIAPGLSSDTDPAAYTAGGKYTEDISRFFRLADKEGNKLSLPASGEALISISLAARYNIAKGDSITLRDEDMNEIHATVTGIFVNHVYNYVILSPDDLDTDINGAYINYPEGTDIHKVQSRLSDSDNVVYVTVYDDFKTRLTKMMSSLDYIVLIVIISAAGLAFVVLYNLTNINITERIREIATIKVLGFYPSETAQYVFRENIVLTFFGMLVGLVLGILLHRFVMAQIVVDMVYFKQEIRPMSYVYSIVLTFLFTFMVNLVMRRKLEHINMAESLKSVE